MFQRYRSLFIFYKSTIKLSLTITSKIRPLVYITSTLINSQNISIQKFKTNLKLFTEVYSYLIKLLQ